jgi:hypothetical protein
VKAFVRGEQQVWRSSMKKNNKGIFKTPDAWNLLLGVIDRPYHSEEVTSAAG